MGTNAKASYASYAIAPSASGGAHTVGEASGHSPDLVLTEPETDQTAATDEVTPPPEPNSADSQAPANTPKVVPEDTIGSQQNNHGNTEAAAADVESDAEKSESGLLPLTIDNVLKA